MTCQVYWYHDVTHPHSTLPDVVEIGAGQGPYVVGDKEVPEGVERGEYPEWEEGAIHDDLDKKGEWDGDEDGHEEALKYFLNHFEIDNNSKVNFTLDSGDNMIDPKDNKLDIGDKPNNDENKHIDIPLKPKVQQYFSVVERS